MKSCSCHKRESRIIRRLEWGIYRKDVEATIKTIVINQKNLITTSKLGGCEVEFGRYSRGVRCLKGGNEDIEGEGGAPIFLPQPNGGIQQLQNEVCIHEGITLNLLKEE